MPRQGDANSRIPYDPVTGNRQWVGAYKRKRGNGLITAIATGSQEKLKKAKRKIMLRGLASLDKRGEVAKVYRQMRSALTDQYGGADAITPAQEMLIEMFCRGKTYLNHVDVTLHELGRLTNQTKRKAIPLLMERFAMAKVLGSQLEQLGLARKGRMRSLAEDLAQSPTLLDKDGTPTPEGPGRDDT